MLQVDENIGGRQDQKYNGLRTKTLAVGLLMMVGCFAVGYFSAGTTTTAHTRGVSSPNVNVMVSNLQHYPYVHITNNTPYVTNAGPNPNPNPNPKPWWVDDDSYGRDLLSVSVDYDGSCSPDYVYEAIGGYGGSWTASSRGVCLVNTISAFLAFPGFPDGLGLECRQYKSSGTSYSQYSIIMDGEDACSVVRI